MKNERGRETFKRGSSNRRGNLHQVNLDNLDTRGRKSYDSEKDGLETKLSDESTYNSGESYEADLLGEVNYRKEDLKKYQDRKNYSDSETYLRYKDSVEFAMEHQPSYFDQSEGKETEWNPESPPLQAPLLNELVTELRYKLQNQENLISEDSEVLGFTAVGSPADIYHNIDAFIIIKDEKEKNKVLTIDVTQRDKSADNKADIVVKGDLPPDDSDARIEAGEKLASKAVEILKKKYRI